MKIITITSGKGGVGKTNISVNLAIDLSRKGYKTCLFDADIGLANVNILMGIVGQYTLEDVISGSKKLKDVIITNWNGIDIIPGSTGVEYFESISGKTLDNLISQFSKLVDYDYIIVDTGAGISKSVVAFCLASSLLFITIVPEPTSLTDAYSLIKVLKANGLKNQVNIIVNRSKSSVFSQKVFQKFNNTVSKYIQVNLLYMGMIYEDENVSEAVSSQMPFLLKYPETKASQAIQKITDNLIHLENASLHDANSMEAFIKTCSNFFQGSLKLIKQPPEKQEHPVGKVEKNNEAAPKKVTQKYNHQSIPAENNAAIELLTKLVANTEKIAKDIDYIKNYLQNKSSSNEYELRDQLDESEPVLTLDFEKFVQNRHK